MNSRPSVNSELIHFFWELWFLVKQPRFRSILIWMVILVIIGTTFFCWVENWSILDSLYFSIVTLTTVGYGDFSPTTTAGKLFAIIYMIFGLSLIAASISVLAMERQAMHLQKSNGSRSEDESL
ncbi:MAG: two pore domain potassium channel family protein [Chloroflexi bacterium]|nr:two pore domain potassium channel family protein [Chloroflexota bacterium]